MYHVKDIVPTPAIVEVHWKAYKASLKGVFWMRRLLQIHKVECVVSFFSWAMYVVGIYLDFVKLLGFAIQGSC